MLANLLFGAFTQDSLVWGGFTFILGVLVIFFGMTILVLAVSGMGMAIKKFDKIKAEKSKPTKTVEITKVAETTESDEVPEHVRVAIVAAIAAYYADSGVKNEFKVKKIKRI